jgi:hypothetical protein
MVISSKVCPPLTNTKGNQRKSRERVIQSEAKNPGDASIRYTLKSFSQNAPLSSASASDP